jgi:twitching motility protein PilT
MQTFDQSIYDLYSDGMITFEEALLRATNVDDFKLRVQGIRSAADAAREEMQKAMSDFDRGAGGGG